LLFSFQRPHIRKTGLRHIAPRFLRNIDLNPTNGDNRTRSALKKKKINNPNNEKVAYTENDQSS